MMEIVRLKRWIRVNGAAFVAQFVFLVAGGCATGTVPTAQTAEVGPAHGMAGTAANSESSGDSKAIDAGGSSVADLPRTFEFEGAKATLSTVEVVDGGVIRILIEAPGVKEIYGRFQENQFEFYPSTQGPQFREALLGIPFDFAPGVTQVDLQIGKGPGAKAQRIFFHVKRGNYRSETLKVDPGKVNPKPKDLVRIRKEIQEVGLVYSQSESKKLWTGPFILPVASEMTSHYGTRRVFNGQLKSYHNGLDLRAPTGTPIVAPAPGIVALAKDLFFTGGTVILDHGYGIFTLYAHMSRVQVKKGQMVQTRDQLGLSGMTGRASGPHLHWGTVVNKVKVDPELFIKWVQ